MTGDKVWYFLLKPKQDVRFSFFENNSDECEKTSESRQKQHAGEPQFERSSWASISAKEAPICVVQSLARSSVPALHDAAGTKAVKHVHVPSKSHENGNFSKAHAKTHVSPTAPRDIVQCMVLNERTGQVCAVPRDQPAAVMQIPSVSMQPVAVSTTLTPAAIFSSLMAIDLHVG